MFILAIIVFGMLIGWLAQFIVSRGGRGTDWALALGAGIGGSFVGGLLSSLISGDGLAVKPSGLIGSIVGAVVITAIWQWFATKQSGQSRGAR